MFDKFGEFDSVEELNKAAEGFVKKGDFDSLYELAAENGIDKEEAEDYLDAVTDCLATPLMAATGKINVEAKHLKIAGLLEDWKNLIVSMCIEDEKLMAAVRRKGKNLCECMAALIKFSFENKEKVNDEIVKACKVKVNGKTEQMRSPLYLGVPSKKTAKTIITKYYLGK